MKKIVLQVKRFVRSGEENCAVPKKQRNILYINALSGIGEEICALPVKKIVRKEPRLFPSQYFGHFLSERDEQMRPQTG